MEGRALGQKVGGFCKRPELLWMKRKLNKSGKGRGLLVLMAELDVTHIILLSVVRLWL